MSELCVPCGYLLGDNNLMKNLSKGLLVLSIHLLSALYWNDLKTQSNMELNVKHLTFFGDISGFILDLGYISIS